MARQLPASQEELESLVRDALWTDSVPPGRELTSPELIDIFKECAELADRSSSRRSLANTLFLTLNAASLATIAVLIQHPPNASRVLLFVPWFILIGACLLWWWILRGFLATNSAKYLVLGQLESRIGVAPLAAEWAVLGRIAPFHEKLTTTRIELFLPLLFGIAYTTALVIALAV